MSRRKKKKELDLVPADSREVLGILDSLATPEEEKQILYQFGQNARYLSESATETPPPGYMNLSQLMLETGFNVHQLLTLLPPPSKRTKSHPNSSRVGFWSKKTVSEWLESDEVKEASAFARGEVIPVSNLPEWAPDKRFNRPDFIAVLERRFSFPTPRPVRACRTTAQGYVVSELDAWWEAHQGIVDEYFPNE